MVKSSEHENFVDNLGRSINMGKNTESQCCDSPYTPEEEAYYQRSIKEAQDLISEFLPGEENKTARAEAYLKLPSKTELINEYRGQSATKPLKDTQLIQSTRILEIINLLPTTKEPKTKFVIVLCVILLATSFLFPPWVYTFQRPGMGKIYKPAGFGFILSPPSPERYGSFYGISIDTTRLAIESIIIIAIAILAIWLMSHKKIIRNNNIAIFIFIFIPSMILGMLLSNLGIKFYRSKMETHAVNLQDAGDLGNNLGIDNQQTESSTPNQPEPIQKDIAYIYTYYDLQGRLVINNLPPNSPQNQGLTLKHVGVREMMVQTSPGFTKQEMSK